ncbi:MAG: PucR family transcriptional regulator ligand-binding domain-containing protein [Microbacterium sp.]
MVVEAETPTLRTLLARRDLQLRLEGEETALDPDALQRPIRWVHSSDLADPTPFLSDGLALLTTGTQFQGAHEDAAVYVEYVRRLTARGVVGLGFGTEVVRDGIPPQLARACRQERMPLFEVPYRTPFIAVARAGAEAIAAQAYARRSWALAAQRAISLAALRPDGLGATLAELAKQLNTWVGMYDSSGALTREHPNALPSSTADELRDSVGAVLRRGARAGSSLRIDGVPFTLQTLGRGGHLRGVIAIAAGDLDQEGRGVVTAVVAMAGLALEQQQGLDRARSLLRAGLLQSLRSGDPSLARRIARDLWGGLPVAPIVAAMTDATAARSDALREWLELRADERRGGVFFGRGDDGLVLIVPVADESLLEEVADRFGVRVGISDPAGYDAIAGAIEQARVARERGTSSVSRFAQTLRGGVLAVPPTPEGKAVAEAVLAPLRRYDLDHATNLLETVRVWLDHDCSHEASARALGVHRHTIRARIAAAERALEVDLGSFAARADVWAALRVSEG